MQHAAPPAPLADPRAAAARLVVQWRAAVATSPALAALDAFNARLAQGLSPSLARAFAASLYAFNHGTPSGIAQLAGRWGDHLALTDPLHAHRHAARVLASAVDEHGLTGSQPHVELFAAFAARWDVAPATLLDRTLAVPAARTLGDHVAAAYRNAPLTTALTVHFVSEETSTAEFAAWGRIFPEEEYTRVHAILEPGHSTDAGDALAHHLAAHPDEVPLAEAAIAPYLDLYRAMWDELAALGALPS